ncbi:MAG: hypothetical protein EOP05_12760, partial [Proteobacteria bacterium]
MNVMQLNDSHSLRRLLAFVLIAFVATGIERASAQTIEQSATYVSQMDADLTLRRVSVLPVSDNVDGIYARPIESQLISLVKEAHRWVREQIKSMYRKVVSKLPYQGLILSRQNNRITINLGKSDGLVKDQTVTAIQIISIQRHPKFNFLVSSDKEILGRIKILKVDDSLSFGAIVSEKERGAIARFAKISALEDVNYGEPSGLNPETDRDVRNRSDAGVAFGKDAREWVPAEPPSFGQVALTLGLGSFGNTSNLEGSECCEAKTSIYPSLGVQGELWINPRWAARLELTQGVISTDNPREGSSPKDLNQSYSRYALMLGYNFLLQDDFFGPKIQLNLGL